MIGTVRPPTAQVPGVYRRRLGDLVVTALNVTARSWWERLGFHPFDPDEPEQLDLYLLTAEIEATLEKMR